MDCWVCEYCGLFGIVLIDCIIIDVFLCDFDFYFVKFFDGFCYDLGDLLLWVEKIIVYYFKLGIDLLIKILVFFDGFDLLWVLKIYCVL